MLKKTIKFIHTLRVFLLVFIVIAFFTVLGINPVDISKFVGSKIGRAVGMSISVPENPFNKLALQLKEREIELDARERDLAGKELALNNIFGKQFNFTILALSIGIGILFILVVFNYYLDYRRKKKKM